MGGLTELALSTFTEAGKWCVMSFVTFRYSLMTCSDDFCDKVSATCSVV